MIKVFLVEDEIIVRNGIKKQIDWEAEGLEFVGEASDGELAYQMIQLLKPDILITDIKMPFMDGLQLSKLVKKEMPFIKIIILSGHNEFEFAKEAINIGITSYLLKPIGSVELLDEVVRVRNIIFQEQIEKKNLESCKLELSINKKIKRQKFFSALLWENVPIPELLEMAEKLNIDLIAGRYNIILANIFEKEECCTRQEEKAHIIQEITSRIEKNRNVIIFDRDNDGIAYLMKGSDDDELKYIISKITTCFKDVLKDFTNMQYFMGIGLEVNRLSELNKCFDYASKAFSCRYFVEKDQVIDSSNMNEYRIVKHMGIDMNNLDINKFNKTMVESFLRTGLQEEVRHFLHEYFNNIGECNIKSYILYEYLILDLYFSCISLIEEFGYDSNLLSLACGDPQSILSSHFTLEQAVNYLEKAFQTVIEYRIQSSSKKYTNILQNAKKYINENIGSEDISLNTVANQVNVSPSYFSTIFSQETGQNFVEYLTNVRMKKAKELLRSSSMKSSEIGYAVGYKDPHYFSYIFKKTQGVTPIEYRRGN